MNIPLRICNLNVFLSNNNSLITVTDITGRMTFFNSSAGQFSPNDRSKDSVYYCMIILQKAFTSIREVGFTQVIPLIRAPGGIKSRTYNQNCGFVQKYLQEIDDLKIYNSIEVTPIPHDGTKVKYGRRGRRK